VEAVKFTEAWLPNPVGAQLTVDLDHNHPAWILVR
jgi:hypothetical protein